MASTGVAKERFDIDAEDTITLTVEWQMEEMGTGSVLSTPPTVKSIGTAVYTSSWVAPRATCTVSRDSSIWGTRERWDQGHRGYNMADDAGGYKSVNPLFMKYTPTDGKFSGQPGYGYRSFEAFIDAVQTVNSGLKLPLVRPLYGQSGHHLPHDCHFEAGRRSLTRRERSRLCTRTLATTADPPAWSRGHQNNYYTTQSLETKTLYHHLFLLFSWIYPHYPPRSHSRSCH